MFDPTLSIESGIERLGEIVDGRQIDVPAGDPIFDRVRRSAAALQQLFNEKAVHIGFGGIHLDSSLPSHVALYGLAFPEYKKENYVDLAELILARQRLRFIHDGLAYFSSREAILNALEHGPARGVSIRQLVGTHGDFWAIAQGQPGPALEPVLAKAQSVGLSNYFVGNHLRGCGMREFHRSQASVWYVQNLHEYALLIFNPSTHPPTDLDAPVTVYPVRPSSWQPRRGSLDERLWNALVDCKAGTSDPREYYADFFEEEGLSLEEGLAGMDPRVQELFELNVRGYLGEEV